MALAPVKPCVLAWAIEESGHPEEEVAKRVKVPLRILQGWLQGEGLPNITQLKKLASITKRAPTVLLLPEPPRTRRPSVQFRHPPKTADRHLNPNERVRLREAWRLQKGLAWVLRELGSDAVDLPKFNTNISPERAAATVRDLLEVTAEQQLDWTDSEAPQAWRRAIESIGVYVLFLPLGEESARGFSVWNDLAPLIAVNTHWAPTARIFSMFHELGHLVLRKNSACEQGPQYGRNIDPIEKWCEQFAAALLLPWRDVQHLLRDAFGWRDGERITDLKMATRVANKFHVSKHAAVIRLIEKGVAGWELYQQIPAHADKKKGGGMNGGRTRVQARIGEYGHRLTLTFLAGMQRDVLTTGDVTSYLNVSANDLPELAEAVS